MVFSCLMYSLGTFLFIGTKNYSLLVLGKALSGIAQAWVSTYAPVWINEFSPISVRTVWMGCAQASGIIGGVVGAIIGSIAADNQELGIADWFDWRTTLFIPALGFTKIAITFFVIDNQVIDYQAREKE